MAQAKPPAGPLQEHCSTPCMRMSVGASESMLAGISPRVDAHNPVSNFLRVSPWVLISSFVMGAFRSGTVRHTGFWIVLCKMIRSEPHPLSVFSLVPLNERSSRALDHPKNQPHVSYLPDYWDDDHFPGEAEGSTSASTLTQSDLARLRL
uniref:Uncharacterized protein n=1 Tax=Coccidioides posadasii RMSCC 3488 TaxID=454284 RepID=A0A0J6IK52_COCPO|nr:hypothetical protein CPAG_08609 [Coccidioides posadasii RMSCC 3488]